MMPAKNTTPDFSELIGIFIITIACAAIGWAALSFLLPDSWSLKWGARYFVNPLNVTVQPKPKDCDWGHAPLGDKACHYEAFVSSQLWKKSDKGLTVVSYNDGETWEDPPCVL